MPVSAVGSLFFAAWRLRDPRAGPAQASVQDVPREQSLNADWRFLRGDAPSSADPAALPAFAAAHFDDAAWREIDVPHDWSVEDLPARGAPADPAPVLEVRRGTWLFLAGDSANWSAASLDDSHWTPFAVPGDWRAAPLRANTSVAWLRRHVPAATPAQVAAAKQGLLRLALGTVERADETYLNGVLLGKTGVIGEANGCDTGVTYRNYLIPAAALRADGPNVVAVRVQADPAAAAGLVDNAGAMDVRSGPFDAAAAPSGVPGAPGATGYTVGGVGWYRRTFTAPAAGHSVLLQFDGVYMDSDVWLNGEHLGNHAYGYSTFAYDISDKMVPGAANVLAVRVRSLGKNSRWFAGAGIFRPVSLVVTPKVHVGLWGLRVVVPQDSIDLAARTAAVRVTTTVQNDLRASAAAVVEVGLTDPTGKVVPCGKSAVTVGAANASAVVLTCTLADVALWSPDTPSLYSARVLVTSNGVTDTLDSTFGVRKIHYDAATGFTLNGVVTKMRGGCVHHANGPLGAKTIARAEERRVLLLKAQGYNAIRTSHNPVSRAFVEACNKHGMLLMEEAFDCWTVGKNPDDYHRYFDAWWQRDIASMVQRDQNAPAIVLWSIGNEIPERATETGAQLSRKLADFVRSLDPLSDNGRGITAAYPGVTEDADAFFDPLDVAGYNYSPEWYGKDHARNPERVITGTESYPIDSFQMWAEVLTMPHVIGDFIWTAIDYIGESALGSYAISPPACEGSCNQPYPYHISFCGDLDIVGLRKPQSYYRSVLWNMSRLEMAVHAPIPAGTKEVLGLWGWPDERQSWTWDALNQSLDVNVYSTYDAVELLLNGQSLGRQRVSWQDEFTAKFAVPYAPGKLEARGLRNDNGRWVPMDTRTFQTAGAPAALRASADRAALRAQDRDDLVYVVLEVVDAHGVLTFAADDKALSVSLEGSGAELAALATGDPRDVSSFSATAKAPFRGQLVAIVRPTVAAGGASVTLRASAPGLAEAEVTLQLTGQEPTLLTV